MGQHTTTTTVTTTRLRRRGTRSATTMSKMMTRSTTSMRLGGKKKTTPKKSGTVRQGGVGYRKFEGRPLYLPDIDPPAWLDGSMIGDRGFDPLGLAKPTEFIQMDLDQLDQNKAIKKAGAEILGGAKYAGLDLPFDVTQVSYIEAILMLGVEVLRNTERDLEKRCYPGGYFDPLDFASDAEKSVNLKEAEIRHCRLAMVAMFGLGTQALLFNKGCLESLSYFGNSFNGTA